MAMRIAISRWRAVARASIKLAILAPIPRARVRMAMQLMTGFFSNWRKANFKSFITQRLHWIDPGRAPRRPVACEECDRSQQQCDPDKCEWVSRADAEQQAAQYTGQGQSPSQPQPHARDRQGHALAQDQSQ